MEGFLYLSESIALRRIAVSGPVNRFVPVRRSLPEIHLVCITTPPEVFEICDAEPVDLKKQEVRESNSMDRSDNVRRFIFRASSILVI